MSMTTDDEVDYLHHRVDELTRALNILAHRIGQHDFAESLFSAHEKQVKELTRLRNEPD